MLIPKTHSNDVTSVESHIRSRMWNIKAIVESKIIVWNTYTKIVTKNSWTSARSAFVYKRQYVCLKISSKFYAIPWLVYVSLNSTEVSLIYFAWLVFWRVLVLSKSRTWFVNKYRQNIIVWQYFWYQMTLYGWIVQRIATMIYKYFRFVYASLVFHRE